MIKSDIWIVPDVQSSLEKIHINPQKLPVSLGINSRGRFLYNEIVVLVDDGNLFV